jgi:hypothetical protein
MIGSATNPQACTFVVHSISNAFMVTTMVFSVAWLFLLNNRLSCSQEQPRVHGDLCHTFRMRHHAKRMRDIACWK